MANLFARASAEHSLFKDERVLYTEFVPLQLPHRNQEINDLVYALKPAAEGKKPHNLFIFGTTGTGKTVTAKFVLNQLQEFSDRVKGLYVNCFEFNTRQMVLSELVNFLGMPVPRRGVSSAELHTKLLEVLKNSKVIPIIVLDEADQLLFRDGAELLYDVLRVNEMQKNFIGVMMISNDDTIPSKLEDRIKSSLAPDTIVFNPYSPEQLKDILKERVELAFHPEKIGKEVVNVAAAHAAKCGGDVRIAIEVLLKAGRLAEKNNSNLVEVEHVRAVLDSVEPVQLKKSLNFLTPAEKQILKLIAMEEGEMQSGTLYEKFSQTTIGLSDRRLRELIARLEAMRLISIHPISMSNRGKSRGISLTLPKETLLKELEAKN